ncbi:unnamed protein product, partial [Choristocarpus tenellus]
MADKINPEIDIHWAARKGDVTFISAYIKEGGSFYARDKHGNPPLHVACFYGNEEAVKSFLEAGVDPSAVNSMGVTPMFWAEKNGYERCVELLRRDYTMISSNRCSKDEFNEKKLTTMSKTEDIRMTPSAQKVTIPSRHAAGSGKNILKDKKFSARGEFEDSCVLSSPLEASQVSQEAQNDVHHWQLYHNGDGDAYYYDHLSGESKWVEETTDEKWVLYHDPASGYPYYLNSSGESVWAEPDCSSTLEGSVMDITDKPPPPPGSDAWDGECNAPPPQTAQKSRVLPSAPTAPTTPVPSCTPYLFNLESEGGHKELSSQFSQFGAMPTGVRTASSGSKELFHDHENEGVFQHFTIDFHQIEANLLLNSMTHKQGEITEPILSHMRMGVHVPGDAYEHRITK